MLRSIEALGGQVHVNEDRERDDRAWQARRLSREKHRGADQWLFVADGSGEAIVNGHKYDLQPGTLVLIERGDTHEIRNTGYDALKTLNFYVPPLTAGMAKSCHRVGDDPSVAPKRSEVLFVTTLPPSARPRTFLVPGHVALHQLQLAPLPKENHSPDEKPGQQTNCDAGVSKKPAI